jgi:putative sigma-54 modulation protein
MRVTITTKGYRLTDDFKDLIHRKLARLDKLFGRDTEARIHLKQTNNTSTLELTVFFNGMIRAEVKSINDMEANIDSAIRKLCRQVDKHKSRFDAKIRNEMQAQREFYAAGQPDDRLSKVVKRKKYALKPMSVEEAMCQIDLLDQDFFVFLDEKTGAVDILYRREDDDFGLIETDK